MTHFVLDNPIMLKRILVLLNNLDLTKKWDVTVQRHSESRTRSQDGLYWRWVGIVADETGHDKDEIHHLMKTKFLDPIVLKIGDESMEYRSITKLSAKEMSAYMEKVYAFVTSQLGIALPVPEELHEVR
ncbi:MAG: hypothetical protein KGL39_58775 [Patescibacteria group bacterium]|nr:hypothetical protein [Patescibacteria group bacterium]